MKFVPYRTNIKRIELTRFQIIEFTVVIWTLQDIWRFLTIVFKYLMMNILNEGVKDSQL
ncbi:unnamed protein product [Paramecium sonneborni]|uniref:Uncharacterized protein n=1 Tax=Paramecium sonneborni TaxID=65129 RepID=A0A8S1NWM6_9CILI|nr:unnamed protein product [Paramecium sonneborni]